MMFMGILGFVAWLGMIVVAVIRSGDVDWQKANVQFKIYVGIGLTIGYFLTVL